MGGGGGGGVGLSWFWPLNRMKLGLFFWGGGGSQRRSSEAKEGDALGDKGEDPLGGNTQRKISLGGNRFLALKKKKKKKKEI